MEEEIYESMMEAAHKATDDHRIQSARWIIYYQDAFDLECPR